MSENELPRARRNAGPRFCPQACRRWRLLQGGVVIVLLAGCGANRSSQQETDAKLAPGRSGIVLSVESKTAQRRSWNESISNVESGTTTEIDVDEPIDDRQLEDLQRIPQLEVLKLGQAQVSVPGLKSLRHVAQLRQLVMRGEPIEDAGLEQLGALKSLRVLNLPRTRISNDGLRHLAAFSDLQLLRLGSPVLDDDGLRRIAELCRTQLLQLKFLHLMAPGVSDAGLAAVAEIKSLQSFYLDDSSVTDDGLERLILDRPDLHIHVDQRHSDRDPQRGHDRPDRR
jgi:hypothetical protein